MADESWRHNDVRITIGPSNYIEIHCPECADKIMFWHRRTEHKMWENVGKYIYWDTKNLVGVACTVKGAELLVKKHNEKVKAK